MSSHRINLADPWGSFDVEENAIRFGPVATGNVAVDTAAIKAFINGSSPGDCLAFPGDEYTVNATIAFLPNRRYVGAGAKGASGGRTVFKMAAGANLDAILASDTWLATNATPASAAPVVFEHICFDGNRTNQTSGLGYGLVGFNFQSSVIECKFANTFGHGLVWTSVNQGGNEITNSCNELVVDRCTFSNCGGDCFHVIEGSTARCTDGHIINCPQVGNNSLGHGIVLDKGAGWRIAGNHVYAVQKSAIKVSQAFFTHVLDNYLEGWGISTSVATYCGIDMTNGFVAGSAGSVVAGNKIWMGSTIQTGVTCRGIAVTAASGVAARVSITGNFVYGKTHTTPTSGILLNCADGAGSMTAALAGNQVFSCDVPFHIGSTGSVFCTGGPDAGNVGALVIAETFAATFAFTPARAAVNGHQRLVLSADLGSWTIANGLDGQKIELWIIQDGTGSRLRGTPPANVAGWPTLSTGANAVDIIRLQWSAIDAKWQARLL